MQIAYYNKRPARYKAISRTFPAGRSIGTGNQGHVVNATRGIALHEADVFGDEEIMRKNKYSHAHVSL